MRGKLDQDLWHATGRLQAISSVGTVHKINGACTLRTIKGIDTVVLFICGFVFVCLFVREAIFS